MEVFQHDIDWQRVFLGLLAKLPTANGRAHNHANHDDGVCQKSQCKANLLRPYIASLLFIIDDAEKLHLKCAKLWVIN